MKVTSGPNKQPSRIIYLDYLRIFAIFAVIIIHISAQNWNTANVNSFAWQIFNFYDSIARWAVPVFVMISGSLFLDKGITTKKLYSKYILRLAVSFIAWSTLYAILTNGNSTSKIAAIIQGHYHMWFILMIIGLYICTPIIRAIIKNEKLTQYFLSLSIIFAFLLPTLSTLINDFASDKVISFFSEINHSIGQMNVSLVMGYIGYFILGYYLSRKSLTKKQRIVIYTLGLISFIYTITLNSLVAIKIQQPHTHYYENFQLNILLESVSIFTFFKYRVFPQKLQRVISIIAKNCFGVYLVHVIIMDQLASKLHLSTLSFNPLLSVPIISILVFAISLFISWILHKVPIIKKFLV